MAAKDVVFGGEARARMVEGVNILANAVKVTLGPVSYTHLRHQQLPERFSHLAADPHGPTRQHRRHGHPRRVLWRHTADGAERLSLIHI